MSVFSPDAWEGIGVVTIVILVALVSAFALVRGWIVPGWYHRSMLETKDGVIETHVETIRDLTGQVALFAEAETKRVAADNLTSQVADQVRLLMESRSGVQ